MTLPMRRVILSVIGAFWATTTTAMAAPAEQAVDFYTNGSLINASEFPAEGEGFLKIFRPRLRGFATDDLIDVVTQAATLVDREFPGRSRLQIADSSAEFGGAISRHASHQNGLDVDVACYVMNDLERNPNDPGDKGFNETFVKAGKLSSNFDVARNWALAKALVASGKINRIFTDEVLKRALCEFSAQDSSLTAEERTETLRRLRHYPNHKGHFHIRLKCPPHSPRCRDQDEPPAGDGCGMASRAFFRRESVSP